jgi:branched-chain amino acid transport system permease protein
VETLVSILGLGTTYALLAAGVVIVYKASRVVNFAHGELAIVGGYVFYSTSLLSGANTVLGGLVASTVISVGFGVVIYLSLMRRLIGEPTYVAAIVTIGLAIMLKALIVIVWESRSVGLDLGRQTIYAFPGGGKVTAIDAITLGVGVLFFVLLYLFFAHTRLGRQFRGAAENPLLASQRQVNVNLILGFAWGLAVFSACLAGVLYGSRSMLAPQSTIIGISGLTAALVGGLDSLRGAALGGLLVAATIFVTARAIDPALSEAAPFVILLVVMSLRPWGLFGTREELDRV